MTIVYIALGSNMDSPKTHIQTATQDLHQLPQTRLLCISRLYQSSPMGPIDQPDFINACAKLETELSATTLLTVLKNLEESHGRHQQAKRWGPRPLDLDILFYGQASIISDTLTVPHPGLWERAFVLAPLADLLDNGDLLARVDSVLATLASDDVTPLAWGTEAS